MGAAAVPTSDTVKRPLSVYVPPWTISSSPGRSVAIFCSRSSAGVASKVSAAAGAAAASAAARSRGATVRIAASVQSRGGENRPGPSAVATTVPRTDAPRLPSRDATWRISWIRRAGPAVAPVAVMKLALVLAPALALAGTGCVERVNRAAMVPHATPILANGNPLDTPAEFSAGASSVAHTTLSSSDESAAVEIPGTQLEGSLRVRLGRYGAIGLVVAHGLASTAQQIKREQPDVEGTGPLGKGFQLTASIPTGDPRWHVGLAAEFLSWTVPYVEYGVCVENCGGIPWTSIERGEDEVGQAAFAVIPTYRSGRWNLWGGLTARSHPTIQQKGVESSLDFEGDVEAGSFNTIVSAGADIEFGGGVRAGMTLYQVVVGQPANYGPAVSAMVTIPLGGSRRAAVAKAAAATPPAPVVPAGAPGSM